jgi:hypothetical protein
VFKRVKGAKWVQVGSNGVKTDQKGSSGVRCVQEGQHEVKWGQIGLIRVKWGICIVGNMGICLVCGWVKAKGWVKC